MNIKFISTLEWMCKIGIPSKYLCSSWWNIFEFIGAVNYIGCSISECFSRNQFIIISCFPWNSLNIQYTLCTYTLCWTSFRITIFLSIDFLLNRTEPVNNEDVNEWNIIQYRIRRNSNNFFLLWFRIGIFCSIIQVEKECQKNDKKKSCSDRARNREKRP